MALSGGVDSAVSAALLKKQGYDVVCVHLVCWEDEKASCDPDKNRVDAAKVAGVLNLPLLVWDFTKEYKKKVIDYFYYEYEAGRTPNPDVMCNKEIKFGLFFERAMSELKADFVATGHYARIFHLEGGRSKLLCGKDKTKDQSYFLYLLTPNILSKTLFPLGNYTKVQVRKLAKKMRLPVWYKPDSQGICFVGKIDIKDFLSERIQSKKGAVLDMGGDVIGEHTGAWFYTIGQRRGFTVFGFGKEQPAPLYVISKDINKNTITVGSYDAAFCDEFRVKLSKLSKSGVSRFGSIPIREYPGLRARVRHLGELYPVENIIPIGKDLCVKLSKKAFGVASGQSAVFYYKDEVLGGGVII